jgi:molybdate transport system substrate-binding protein
VPRPSITSLPVARAVTSALALGALALLAVLAPLPAASVAASASSRATAPRTITVFAAASLSEPFAELGALLHREHPDLAVRFSFAGSQQLAAQLALGARADVFAPADERWMRDAVSRALVAGTPVAFAGNELIVILPLRNPARIADLRDLARGGVKLVLAADAVPAGRYARRVLDRLGRSPGYPPDFARRVLGNVVSEEDNVKAIVGKVRLGEADAGIVYRSDALGAVAGHVRTLRIPPAANVHAVYPVAVLRDAPEPAPARAFVALLLSPRGQAVLRRFGFDPVPGAPR